MSATIASGLGVQQARQRLSDVSRLSPEQVSAAQDVLDRFRASRPRNQACVACGSMVWVEHENASGEAIWACSGCHRPVLTTEEWSAERARQGANGAHSQTGAPDPRDTLRDALARLTAARRRLSEVSAALPSARTALAMARERHVMASAAVEEVEAATVASMARKFLGQAGPPAPSQDVARAQLAVASDAVENALAAKQHFDGAINAATLSVDAARTRAGKAAIAVIAFEQLEDLLDVAVEARAAYVEAIGKLGWLLRNGMSSTTDARARQLVAGADTAPSTWQEAKVAGTGQMEAALAALLRIRRRQFDGRLLLAQGH
jgi:hypothetical protein